MSIGLKEGVEVLRAAGEPSRLRIVALLAREELAVMELCQIMDQSQPRVSRHLRLLTASGLVERFPDGGWAFYRLTADPDRKAILDRILPIVDEQDAALVRDLDRLAEVRAERAAKAQAYFERNAPLWDQLRSLYVSESDVEDAILAAAPEGPIEGLIDLGTGAGRMLTLLAGRAKCAVGLDLSHQMLNIARLRVAEAGLKHVELRHGDVFSTGLQGRSAELVVMHQVLHYLSDPAAAVAEAARLVSPGGRLLVIDFAPHGLEYLREAHQHRRLGFPDEEMARWISAGGLKRPKLTTLPASAPGGLTVKIWAADRR
ncbi:MAG TPA: metalloregulator ArsR/SmtB family transcription factor [Caulobacteraceae bacterium]|nr:metalloregulator ArsR/SmtB family transcription factor [Caulobacteraceae bacterium]